MKVNGMNEMILTMFILLYQHLLCTSLAAASPSRSFKLFGRNTYKQNKRSISSDSPIQSMEKNMQHVSVRIAAAHDRIVHGLSKHGFAIVDNILGSTTSLTYRREAEVLFEKGSMHNISTFYFKNIARPHGYFTVVALGS